MFLLVVVAALQLLSLSPNTETLSWALALAVCAVLVVLRSRELALPRPMLHLLACPLLLLCLSLHGIYTHPLSDVVKDWWYFTLPVVYLSFGYLVYERVGSWQRLLQPMLVVGIVAATYSLVHAVLNRGELAAAASVEQYRSVTGTGNFIPMVPMLLLLLSRRAGLPLQSLRQGQKPGLERWRTLRLYVYVACATTVLVTFSRTHILTLIAGLLVALPYRTLMARLLRHSGLPLVAVLVAVAGGVYFLASAKSGPLELFIDKTLHSGSEVQVRAYETFADITNNWRGFEAYRASKTFEGYGTLNKLFGGGAGSLVDLGIAMQLSTTQAFKYVPVLHNGYMYLLVKTGIAGLCVFVVFMLQLLYMAFRALRLRDPEAMLSGLILLWVPLVVAGTQGVITGLYNKGELIPVLLIAGAAAASYAKRRQQQEAWLRSQPLRRGSTCRMPATAAALVPEPLQG